MATDRTFNRIPLNVDCWIEIFQYLNIFELTAVSESYHEFQNIVNSFKKSYTFEIDIKWIKSDKVEKKFRTILTNVGHHIKNLRIINLLVETSDFSLEFIINNCPNLKYLHIENFANFSRIQKFQLDYLNVLVLENFKFVNASSAEANNMELVMNMKSLEKLIIINCLIYDNSMELQQFFKIYGPNLKSINIRKYLSYEMNFFNVLTQYCQQLESISLELNDEYNFDYLSEFKKLKRIEFIHLFENYNESFIVSDDAGWRDQIEEFHFFTHCYLNLFQVLEEYQNLKILKLIGCTNLIIDLSFHDFVSNLNHLSIGFIDNFTNFDLMRIIKYCRELKFLEISKCNLITGVVFNEIALLLQRERFRSKLKITIAGPEEINKQFKQQEDNRLTIEYLPSATISTGFIKEVF